MPTLPRTHRPAVGTNLHSSTGCPATSGMHIAHSRSRTLAASRKPTGQSGKAFLLPRLLDSMAEMLEEKLPRFKPFHSSFSSLFLFSGVGAESASYVWLTCTNSVFGRHTSLWNEIVSTKDAEAEILCRLLVHCCCLKRTLRKYLNFLQGVNVVPIPSGHNALRAP